MDSSQSKLFLWSLTASLAGFLFGFDTIVISGAEQTIQELWKLSPGQHGFAMSSALIGMVFGSLFGAFPTDTFGRKKVLLAISLLYFVTAIWSALTNDLYSFAIARFLGGIGVGISTVAAPLYISEISPAAKRGRLAGLFQFSIVFGVLVAYISNNLLSGVGDDGGLEVIVVFPSEVKRGRKRLIDVAGRAEFLANNKAVWLAGPVAGFASREPIACGLHEGFSESLAVRN